MRGHSLGQSKDQVERISQHHLNMFFDVIGKLQHYLAFVEYSSLKIEISIPGSDIAFPHICVNYFISLVITIREHTFHTSDYFVTMISLSWAIF